MAGPNLFILYIYILAKTNVALEKRATKKRNLVFQPSVFGAMLVFGEVCKYINIYVQIVDVYIYTHIYIYKNVCIYIYT